MINLKEMTDEQLATAYVEGNNRAFDLLLERTQSKLYSYIVFVVRDKNKADDVFQETFVRAITKLHQGSYSTKGKFSAWLVRIAHNVIIDNFRFQKAENIIETEDNDLSCFASNDLLADNIESSYIDAQNKKEARLLMEALPTAQREIVYMRIYQQMSFKEIAEATGLSINTALGRMRYAIMNMRKMANEYKIAI